jgi:uncharacterized membrane protein
VKFLKSALLTGLYVLLPLMLLWIGLREIGGLLASMAEPIADMFPSEVFEDLNWPGIVAAILIAGAALVIGIMAKLEFVANLAEKFDTHVLYRVPMYRMLKIISSSLVRAEKSDVKPALIEDDDGGGDPCYVMEIHKSGMATVLLPWTPASFAGSIKVVPVSKLRYLGCSVDEYSRSISFMGIGVEDCLAQTAEKTDEGTKVT